MVTAAFRFFGVSLAMVCCATPIVAVEFDLLPVGDAGNHSDQNYGRGRFGTVNYRFDIASNEVTVDQYVEFLNAVAKSDPHQLFDPQMQSTDWGEIVRTGEDGNFSYAARPLFGNKPANFIAFWDAARFANWMHNGQPTGPQTDQTTEDGAYFLGGVTYPTNDSVHRRPGAKWFLPSENEWYKAAHFDPRPESEGGPPGDDHYWLYPTSSDEPPIKAITNEFGDVINPGPNVANYDFAASWGGRFGNPATAGSSGSTSYYGLFDAAGSMWEWNESIIFDPARSKTSTFRGIRGASWDDDHPLLRASLRGVGGIEFCGTVFQCFTKGNGFRVAALTTERGDFDGDGEYDVDDIDLLAREMQSDEYNASMDLTMDGTVDIQDRSQLVVDLAGIQFGDSNIDGAFNSSDLVHIFQQGQYEDTVTGNSAWSTGDWNGNGDFESSDFVLALQHSQYESTGILMVPETGHGVTALLAIVLFVNLTGSVRTGFRWHR